MSDRKNRVFFRVTDWKFLYLVATKNDTALHYCRKDVCNIKSNSGITATHCMIMSACLCQHHTVSTWTSTAPREISPKKETLDATCIWLRTFRKKYLLICRGETTWVALYRFEPERHLAVREIHVTLRAISRTSN